MFDPFITFVIFADSLDDSDLLLMVNSIRQQTDMCWELEIRVSSVPDAPTISIFTHDNPRIIVTQRFENERKIGHNSTVISFLPKGLELFANATTELRTAFEEQNVHVVAAKTIFMTQIETDGSLDSACIFPFLLATRLTTLSHNPQLIEEISLPLGIIRKDAFMTVTTDRVSDSSSLQDHEIKAVYLAELESEILVLQTQLQILIQKSEGFEVISEDLNKTKQQLALAKSELRDIKRSRTWRVGRLISFPIRSIKNVNRRFAPKK